MAERRMIGCNKTVEEMQRVMDEITEFYNLVSDAYNINLTREINHASTVKDDLMNTVRKAEANIN